MIELDNLKTELLTKKSILDEIHNSLEIDKKNNRIIEINHLMEENNFRDDIKKANSISKELKDITDSIDTYNKLKKNYNDIYELINLANTENDKNLFKEIKEHYD